MMRGQDVLRRDQLLFFDIFHSNFLKQVDKRLPGGGVWERRRLGSHAVIDGSQVVVLVNAELAQLMEHFAFVREHCLCSVVEAVSCTSCCLL